MQKIVSQKVDDDDDDDDEKERDVKYCFACGGCSVTVTSEGKMTCSGCNEMLTLKDKASVASKRDALDSVQTQQTQGNSSNTRSKEKFDQQRNGEHDEFEIKNTKTGSSEVQTTGNKNVEPDVDTQRRNADHSGESYDKLGHSNKFICPNFGPHNFLQLLLVLYTVLLFYNSICQ